MGLYVGNKFVIDNGSIIYKSSSTSGIGTTENTKIIASDGAANDQFGLSVAAGSGRIVVGAPGKDIGSNTNEGSIYIYDLDGNEVVIKTASDGANSDQFGYSVAVGSNKIVVGAPYDFFGSNFGGAYIFDLDGNELKIISRTNSGSGDYFGDSVAVGSGRIVVGAYGDDIGSNSNQGSAYIFDLDGNELTRITASDAAQYDEFGKSVAVGSGRIVVGAYRKNTDQGAAYIFDLNGNQLGIITASDGVADDSFGYSVAVGYGKIIVGTNNSGLGAAYIYDLDGNNEIKITASDGVADDRFGRSVAVGSSKIIVAAQSVDVPNVNQGAAYIYDLDGTNEIKITASDGAFNDSFGYSVAVGSGRIVVGAYSVDIGSNANQGAAYMWEIDEPLSDYYDEIVDHYRY